MSTPRTNILGVQVSRIQNQQRHYVCVTGVHGVMESYDDATLQAIHNKAGMVTPDGMPLVWISRLRGFKQVDRVYGPDLMLALCDHSQAKGYRHFLYGGADGVPEQLAERLKSKFPDINIVGTYSPPFRAMTAEEDEAVVKMINNTEADIVWVGLSTPKQERWMHAHVGRLNASALLGVGAAFDFHAGLKRQAPRWMQRSGLEWFFRVITEPKRLWRRYLKANPRFIGLILLQSLGLMGFPDRHPETAV
jgi:N-acetylglucosaminyldiphosphoundecaprenol N-acetyl-beta-D-mannosaminyltransferase